MNYEPDKFTESDVLRCLDAAGLKYKQGSRYILSQCPTHEDAHPSVQIYKDDWFVNCHAGCGRYHITKAFPELRPERSTQSRNNYQAPPIRKTRKEPEVKYKKFDQMEYWQSLPLIPRDHYFKNIELDTLDELGWRWVEDKNSYYIPYFSRSKTSIPFSQLRHLEGDRRFTFLKDAKPTCYGTWNLDPSNSPLFIVEGASDAAVMDYCGVPWIALPSAASGELLKAMATWCKDQGIKLVYAGDNDAAGEKLREALDEIMSYRVKQPRHPYKDWGDMFEAEGIKSVVNYTYPELFPGKELPYPEIEPGYISPKEAVETVVEPQEEKTDVQKVLEFFPGSKELEIVGEKKQLETPTVSPLPF